MLFTNITAYLDKLAHHYDDDSTLTLDHDKHPALRMTASFRNARHSSFNKQGGASKPRKEQSTETSSRNQTNVTEGVETATSAIRRQALAAIEEAKEEARKRRNMASALQAENH